MDDTPFKYAYRCLPMDIANASGWELLLPAGFSVLWQGTPDAQSVIVRPDADMPHTSEPVSVFGHGVITFHVNGVFRTPPGWNLSVSGTPNRPKDGIAPLTGIIETDWSPFTFTMNWQITRPNHWIRFDVGEPFCLIAPQLRGVLERFSPRFAHISEDPELEARSMEATTSRADFYRSTRANPPERVSDQWQKHYYQGRQPDGSPCSADHRTHLRLAPFAHKES